MKINARGMRKKILRLYGEDRRVADDDLLLIAQIWAGEGWTSSLSVYHQLKLPSIDTRSSRKRGRAYDSWLLLLQHYGEKALR